MQPPTEDVTATDHSKHLEESTLQAWLEDALPPQLTSMVERHLESCDRCAMKLDDLYEDSSMGVNQWLEELKKPTERRDTLSSHDNAHLTVLTGASAASTPAFQPNSWSSDNKWQRLELLAHGGIGEIWIAKDLQFQRKVALKRLRKEVAQLRPIQVRFLREAQVTAQLCHPCVPQVFDLHDNGPDSFYVMSLIQGNTLRALIQSHHSISMHQDTVHFETLFELLNHFVAVADTIQYAHKLGIIHRDLKSDNVVIGEHGQVTVVDWGLAKFIGEPDDDMHHSVHEAERQIKVHSVTTLAGSRLGTPAFMAPEQVTGDNSKLDQRTDVYGLAAMLYEIVTGNVPFPRALTDEVFDAVLTQVPPPFSTWGSHSFEALEVICRRGLSKNPNDRQQSAAEIGRQVRRWLANEISLKRKTEEREYFFSFTNDLMAILDDETGIRWANPAWERVLGWPADWLVGKTRYDLIHPDDIDEATRVLKDLQNGTLTESNEVRVSCKNGGYKCVHWTAARVPQEKLTYIVGRDTSQLRRRESSLKRMLAVATDALLVVNNCLAVCFFNDAAAKLLHIPSERSEGWLLSDCFPEDFRIVQLALLHKCLTDPVQDHALPVFYLQSSTSSTPPVEVSLRLNCFLFNQEQLAAISIQVKQRSS